MKMHTWGVVIPYANVLTRNVRAARARRGLDQELLAARMRALGFSVWVRQTVARVEGGKRRLSAEEVFGLSYALETSVAALMMPSEDDKGVEFPSGQSVSVGAVRHSVLGYPDESVSWAEDQPVRVDPGRVRRPDTQGKDLVTPQPMMPRFASPPRPEGDDGA